MFSFVLMLNIEPTTNKERKILYEDVYEVNEVMILVWSIVHGVGHCQRLCRAPKGTLSIKFGIYVHQNNHLGPHHKGWGVGGGGMGGGRGGY
jgi:hypothetical protein